MKITALYHLFTISANITEIQFPQEIFFLYITNFKPYCIEFTDSRTMKWTLVPSPIPVLSIILVYLYIIYVGGPKFMKDRRPYSLKGFMQCYNVFQVITNFLILYNVLVYGRPFTSMWKYCAFFDQISGENTEMVRKS